MHRFVKLMAWAFVLMSAGAVAFRRAAPGAPPPSVRPVHRAASQPAPEQGNWFERVKPYCNSVEVVTHLRQDPAPPEWQWQSYAAACYALAGRIDSARAVIERLPPNERGMAAGIVFNVGHPVADMGDDKSAGPIMALVVEYDVTNYMALYHAGASEFQLGQLELAKRHLTDFLKLYTADDGWTGSARGMLERIAAGSAGRGGTSEAPQP